MNHLPCLPARQLWLTNYVDAMITEASAVPSRSPRFLLGNCLAEAIAVQGGADVKDVGPGAKSVLHARRATGAICKDRLSAWQMALIAMLIVGASEVTGARCGVEFPS